MSKKLFTAELRRMQQAGAAPADGAAAPAGAASAVPGTAMDAEAFLQLSEQLKALDTFVRERLGDEAHEQAKQEAERAREAAEMSSLEKQRQEVELLKMEIHALANCIQQTKKEIAALRSNDKDHDRLLAVASELDAVVGSTEGATDSILNAAEKIDALAQGIQAQEQDGFIRHQAEEISEHILNIFEACNFQDITGQRITKVVNTLKFVEERVERMIEIWGRDTFANIIPEDAVPQDEEKRLLNGPALENKGISQDEIDKLFD
ncbi:protein phosphatase CheZ [Caenispirillum bisanense]|uniref:Chemotaxis protein CheZ n=1 Tax=Caenispirillum bisanense TaxID=414052 RepID=A0A286G1X0_9PROT|nr:protein phosphatase CheZ [Caenispirillum bisanense]SOD89179.1 chemotaxis protein CheZ [Caenispirillum bisanense]